MPLYLGLDIGTTTISSIALDVETGRPVSSGTIASQAGCTTSQDRARGRSELDIAKLYARAALALQRTVDAIGVSRSDIRALGVTGQQHGLALLAKDNTPLCPAITWRDQRASEPIPGSEETFLHHFVSLARGEPAFRRMGCLPAAGYLGPSAYWLNSHDRLPSSRASLCSIPDAIVAMLTGASPVTDPTMGGSSGIYDIVSRQWAWEIIERVGLPRALFPDVLEAGEIAGRISTSAAEATGLLRGTPVLAAVGDNQASFLGSVREPQDSVLVNVGTGAQVSAWVNGYQRRSGLDTRSYFEGSYLLVGASLFGGRAYAYMQEFLLQVGEAVFGVRGDEGIYDVMTRLAASAGAGSGGLRFNPLFSGTRTRPEIRASLTGLDAENLTPANLVRALLEGMARELRDLHQLMGPQADSRRYLIGSGNGVRRNPVLAKVLSERFGMPLGIPLGEEAAARGAAMLAATSMGDYESIEAASATVQYAHPSDRDTVDGFRSC